MTEKKGQICKRKKWRMYELQVPTVYGTLLSTKGAILLHLWRKKKDEPIIISFSHATLTQMERRVWVTTAAATKQNIYLPSTLGGGASSLYFPKFRTYTWSPKTAKKWKANKQIPFIWMYFETHAAFLRRFTVFPTLSMCARRREGNLYFSLLRRPLSDIPHSFSFSFSLAQSLLVGWRHTWAPPKKQPRGQNFGH